MNEEWAPIPGFPLYSISDQGRVCNGKTGRIMRPQRTMTGELIVRLRENGEYGTRSIRRLVAEAFVERPRDTHVPFDVAVLLDGNPDNVVADNIMWRPMWFAQTYSRQFNKYSESPWVNTCVTTNLNTKVVYDSVIDASIEDGVLIQDIWKSDETGSSTFPTGHRYMIEY